MKHFKLLTILAIGVFSGYANAAIEITCEKGEWAVELEIDVEVEATVLKDGTIAQFGELKCQPYGPSKIKCRSVEDVKDDGFRFLIEQLADENITGLLQQVTKAGPVDRARFDALGDCVVGTEPG